LIGDFSTIAGVRSVFFTHQISYKENIQTLLPIQIGNFVLVSSGVTTAPGSKIPDNCLVGMGSVLVSKPYLPSTFIAGEAAKSKQSVDGLYFKRTKGRVDFPHHDS
jgi:acetyltransferase-like isoleucine patch superfamily enzyme